MTSKTILFAASEVFPFSMSGGLAQVAGALPKELKAQGNDVVTISPLYSNHNHTKFPLTLVDERVSIPFDGEQQTVSLHEYKDDKGVRHLFVGHPSFQVYNDEAGKPQIYGNWDDAERFARFCRAIPQAAAAAGVVPDVVHCNDWQTGFLPAILKHGDALLLPFTWRENIPATVMTLHRGEFRGPGVSPEQMKHWLRLPGDLNTHFEYDRDACSVWSGVGNADRWTTVSPNYFNELTNPHGYDGLHYHAFKGTGSGVVNGIDTEAWNSKGPNVRSENQFDANDLSGKAKCKAALCDGRNFVIDEGDKVIDLDPSRPTIGILSRISDEKGFDLFADSMGDLVKQGYNIVIAGIPINPQLVDRIKQEAEKYPENVRFVAKKVAPDKAHLIVAGADVTLVPSKSEPCGLTQMEAQQYATLPIVTQVGGLVDTIEDGVTGFKMKEFSKEALLKQTQRALETMENAPQWQQMQKNCLSLDNSWKESGAAYSELYDQAIEANREQLTERKIALGA